MSRTYDPITAALAALRALPEAPVARVFGSVAAGDATAHDVDVVVDLDALAARTPAFGEATLPVPAGGSLGRLRLVDDAAGSAGRLLALVQHAGRRADGKRVIDVFVRAGGAIFRPDATGTHWQLAADGAAIWAKVLTRGMPLAALQWPRADAAASESDARRAGRAR